MCIKHGAGGYQGGKGYLENLEVKAIAGPEFSSTITLAKGLRMVMCCLKFHGNLYVMLGESHV